MGIEMKQQMLGNTIKHEKEALIKVKHNIDSYGERDWTCWIEDDMCIYCSSGGYSYTGIDNEDKSEVLKCLIKELTNELIEKGYKQENIKVEVSYMTKEEFDEWVVRRKEDTERELERTKEELSKLQKEFTKKLVYQKSLNNTKDYSKVWENFENERKKICESL